MSKQCHSVLCVCFNAVDYAGRLYAVNGPASSGSFQSVVQASIIDIDSGNVTYSWQPKSTVSTECQLSISNLVFIYLMHSNLLARQHWIQHITFTAKNNAVCSRGSADAQKHTQTPSVTIPSPLANGDAVIKMSDCMFFCYFCCCLNMNTN